MERCAACNYCGHYYRGKNQKPGCLMMARCEHPEIVKDKESYMGKRYIATYRWSLFDKVKTRPRWCPQKREGR